MKSLRYGSKTTSNISIRKISSSSQLVERVSKILDDVRHNGDAAVLKYTRKFDKVKLSAKDLRVSEQEINNAYQNIDSNFTSSIKVAVDNVRRFYKRHIPKTVKVRGEEGVYLAERIRPIESVGIYVPAGTAPLVSTVYMTVIPAQLAGVENIYLITPPNEHKTVNPYILAVADQLKVKRVYKVGGAQAIGAMAYGTKSIPRVDKIVGPGNRFVAEAKRQVFGYCDIDMIAGPTELVILANEQTDLAFIIADMKAQSEHALGISILITTSKKHVDTIKKLSMKGYVIKVKNINEGIELINQIAPEHLQIMIKRPERIVKSIKNAGAIFLGPYSPTAIGDYIAGPSHVLPTNGSARFFSGLGVNDFLKTSHIISYSRKALERVSKAGQYIAALEGLKYHGESINIRLKD